MRTQEKFTAAMQRLADERNLDLVVDYGYVNTGAFIFQPRNGFTPLLRFPFNFQRDYSSFTGTPEHPLGNSPRGGSWSTCRAPSTTS